MGILLSNFVPVEVGEDARAGLFDTELQASTPSQKMRRSLELAGKYYYYFVDAPRDRRRRRQPEVRLAQRRALSRHVPGLPVTLGNPRSVRSTCFAVS